MEQSKYTGMMTKEVSTKIVISCPLEQGFFAMTWPYKSDSENALFILKSSSILWGMIQSS